MPRFRWENFTTANGLPDNHVFCVAVDGNRIWAGTENGLALYEAASGRCSARRMDWRIGPFFPWRWTSAPAISGSRPWAA